MAGKRWTWWIDGLWRDRLRHPAWQRGGLRVARKERQGQNHLLGFILYDHHQGRIALPALFSQLPDCALGMRKCRRNIRQVRAMRIILAQSRPRIAKKYRGTKRLLGFGPSLL